MAIGSLLPARARARTSLWTSLPIRKESMRLLDHTGDLHWGGV
ncbi:hypothetical protein C3L33_00508, partial [Rhododendron williamsianum]